MKYIALLYFANLYIRSLWPHTRSNTSLFHSSPVQHGHPPKVSKTCSKRGVSYSRLMYRTRLVSDQPVEQNSTKVSAGFSFPHKQNGLIPGRFIDLQFPFKSMKCKARARSVLSGMSYYREGASERATQQFVILKGTTQRGISCGALVPKPLLPQISAPSPSLL